jgi:CRISPR-associated protein Csm4
MGQGKNIGELIMKELLVLMKPMSEFPIVHSDRLFGAICVAIKAIYEEQKLIEILKNFEKEPPFLLSSIFPCVKHEQIIPSIDKNIIYFLPKPIEDVKKIDDHRKYIENYKKLNDVKYVSDDIFNDWTNGKISETYILKNMEKYKIKAGLLFPKDKKLKFDIVTCDTPRNRINRINDLSEDIYYFNGNTYNNANLFFFIRLYDAKYEELLRSVLGFLRDYRGFGKDLSVGKGKFEIEEICESKIIKSLKDNKRFITLSRYIPSTDEINMFKVRNKAYYDISTKRGMTAEGKPKRQVHFFSEGSTFPNLKNIYGRILPVQDKSVEYGLAFNVGIAYE